MKKRYKKSDLLLPVQKPHTGASYHVVWAARGCIWRCRHINEDGTVELITPKTRKLITVKSVDLRHIRSAQDKIEKSNRQ